MRQHVNQVASLLEAFFVDLGLGRLNFQGLKLQEFFLVAADLFGRHQPKNNAANENSVESQITTGLRKVVLISPVLRAQIVGKPQNNDEKIQKPSRRENPPSGHGLTHCPSPPDLDEGTDDTDEVVEQASLGFIPRKNEQKIEATHPKNSRNPFFISAAGFVSRNHDPRHQDRHRHAHHQTKPSHGIGLHHRHERPSLGKDAGKCANGQHHRRLKTAKSQQQP